jgi:uncharacterized repeat protein (TIGR03803 family)
MPPLSSGAEREELDMKKFALALALRSIAAILPLTLSTAAVVAQTGGVTVIADFGQTPTDGTGLNSPLVFDKAGNLYGVTYGGSPANAGTVFELTQKPDGVWARKVLHNFTGGADGGTPIGALVLDAAGNLYGTAAVGGKYDGGTVFELSPRSDGPWKETVLHNFTGYPDGNYPLGGVIFDSAGNLYGTTIYGGAQGSVFPNGGTIFKLTPQQSGGWKESLIHSFTDSEKAPTAGGLTMDRAGNLYGTTNQSNYFGIVYELSPGSDGSWSFTTLHTFPGVANGASSDGAAAYSGVILDADGNLYGTTFYGGTYNFGTVFEIPFGQGPNGPDKILYSFNSAHNGGEMPEGGLVFDPYGNLYGTTTSGGPYGGGGGKIFEMLPNGNGTWTEKTLHNFGGFAYNGFLAIDGVTPVASMVLGPDKNLYGSTLSGGYQPAYPNSTGGTVFRVNLH